MNNPLLNRLFETKSTHKKQRPFSLKDDLSRKNQKPLVPRLQTKHPTDKVDDVAADRQKTVILKPNKPRLPSITQKEIPSFSLNPAESRQRKISMKEDSGLNFMTEFSMSIPFKEEEKEEKIIIESEKRKENKSMKFHLDEGKQEKEDELFEYLKIIEENKELSEEFCYMNRGQLPYSYEIVEYEDRNPKQFLTVSLRGVSIYKGEEAEFTTVKKLSQQIEKYKKLKEISFFHLYLREKVFKHWKYKTIRRKFENQCKYIQKNLFSQNSILQDYLKTLYALADQFRKCKFIDVRMSKTQSLQLLQTTLNSTEKNIVKSLKYFEDSIKSSLRANIEKNLIKFRQDERVTIGSAREGRQEAFLPYDSKKKSMKYTQMAKLKEFEENMYRLLKYTDMVIFSTKQNLIYEGMRNFISEMEMLHRKYLDRGNITFASWVFIKTELKQTGEGTKFSCSPPLQEIKDVLLNHEKSSINSIFKHHKLLISEKDDFFCEEYDNAGEHPSKLDFKYYIQKTDQYFNLKKKSISALEVCLNDIQQFLTNGEETLLKIYDESYLDGPIEHYLQNETLREYLLTYRDHRKLIYNYESSIEFGLAFLDLSKTLEEIKSRFEEKNKQITNGIPIEVANRCESMVNQITEVYNSFKENPSTVMEYIDFIKKYQAQKMKIPTLEIKIQSIYDLEEMVYQNGMRIGENSKIHINQCATYFRELNKRLDEIQSNEEKDRKRFEKIVDDMVEPLDEKSQNLYTRINEDQLIISSESKAEKCLQKLIHYRDEFQKFKLKKEELFHYQDELKMGHKDLPNYFKLEAGLEWLLKIWEGRKKFYMYEEFVRTKGYAFSAKLQIEDLKGFLKNIQLAISELQTVELLQNFKQEGQEVLKIINICKLVSTETLQEEHFQIIQKHLVSQSKKIKNSIFSWEGGRNILCSDLIRQTNLLQIEDHVEEVVFSSSQESLIKRQLNDMEEYWKKNKILMINEDLAKNGVDILHFDTVANEHLLQKLGSYILNLRNIEGSKYSIGEIQAKVTIQISITLYLKKLMEKWIEVQKEWIKLLPLMTNCPSVKHQSNVYFEFTSLDNSIRKLNRQTNDLTSLKKMAEDYREQKYFKILVSCEKELIEVNKIFNNFLEMKRNTYNRFFFLADQELIAILENTKDAKTLANYARLCFNCERILLDKELISGFQSPLEVFKLRKSIIRGEPDEMFKSVEENMKTTLKFNIIALLPKMKIGMNVEQEHKDYSLQAILVADRLLWTEMTESYLNTTTYESYELILRRPCEQLSKYVKKKADKQTTLKYAIRLVQMRNLRDIGEDMIKQQTTKDDFKWKEQLKYTIEDEEIVISQFNRKLNYGLEYYPPSRIIVPTPTRQMLLSQMHYSCVCEKSIMIKGGEGEGSRNNVREAAAEFGCFYRELVCNKNISMQYIMKFVQGAILAGTWVNFYQFEHLDPKVLGNVLSEIHLMKSKILQKYDRSQKFIRMPNRTMFCFITHNLHPQQVSLYDFNTLVMVQPHKAKLSEWILSASNFQHWKEISEKLIIFIETIMPFLEKVMGSFMSILRKILDSACLKKNENPHLKQFQIVALSFKEEVIDKTIQSVHLHLYKAVHCYLGIDLRPTESLQAETKAAVLLRLVENNVPNILVIGSRSNKTRIIDEVCERANKTVIKIYPEASEHFFEENTIQKINTLDEQSVIIYDGDTIIRQWSDLIISGYLLVEGKKVYLNNQTIIQLRQVSDCSPSFVGSCQIVYIGSTLSRKQKFLLKSEVGECPLIMESVIQIFGEELENLKDEYVEILASFLKPFGENPLSKNYHKIIVWFMTIIGEEGLWNRFYGGRYTDVSIYKNSHELVPIDETKYLPTQASTYCLEVPTKSSILYYELGKNMLQKNTPVYVYGGGGSGKTTLLKFFNDAISLPISCRTNSWTTILKNNLTHIRKNGKNMLMSIGEADINIVVDDLDLGYQFHREYLRAMIDEKLVRDNRFEEFRFQTCNILSSGRSRIAKGKSKLVERIIQLNLKELNRQTLSTIFRVNFQSCVKGNKMNKEVISEIENVITKSLLIIFEDLTNIIGANDAGLTTLRVLRNMMSLPKKNSFISGQNYRLLFKTHLKNRLFERAFSEKHIWQYSSVYENLTKIILGEEKTSETMLYTDKQYKLTSLSKIQHLIESSFPHYYIFNHMLNIVIKLNNQFHSFDQNCVLIGRYGTGKRTILKVTASLNKIEITDTLSSAIMSTIKNQEPILMEYCQNIHDSISQVLISECKNDEQLELLVEIQKREEFRQSCNGGEPTRLLKKASSKIRHAIIFNSLSFYKQYLMRNREINEYFASYIDELPVEALVGISGRVEEVDMQLLAEVYTETNKIILEKQESSISLKKFKKYLDVYHGMYSRRLKWLKEKIQFYTQIYSKFNEACDMIREWERKADFFKFKIKTTIEQLDRELTSNRSESLTFGAIYSEKEKEQQIIEDKNIQMRTTKRTMERKLAHMKKIMDKIEHIVLSMQRSEMSQLKKIYKNNKIVTFSLECLCVLFKEDPSERAINKIMADPNLMMKMRSHSLLKERNGKMEQKYKKEFTLIERDVGQASEASRILIDWIKAIMEYWQISQDYENENRIYQEHKRVYEESLKIEASLQKQIKELNEKTMNLNQDYARKIKQKEENEEELQKIDIKRKTAEEIIPALKKSEQQTWNIIKEFRNNLSTLSGNSILATTCLVYLPLKRLKVKKLILDAVKKILNARFIEFSLDFMTPIAEVQDAVLEDLNIKAMKELGGPKIIIDPERRAMNYIFQYDMQLQEKIKTKAETLEIGEDGIYHTTEESMKQLDDVLILDWKYTSLNTNEKIFLKIASHKKPEYFEAKNELNKKIKKDLSTIQEYKVEIYQKICEKNIKILDDEQFLQTGRGLLELELQTEKNKVLAEQKSVVIKSLETEINEEVRRIIILVKALKKAKNVALDIVLDIACSEGNSIQNIIRWALSTLPVKKRSGWLLAITIDYIKDNNEELLSILSKDSPLKMIEVNRSKKPLYISNKNYDNILKLSQYSPGLKLFCEQILKNPKDFEHWTSDTSEDLLLEEMKNEGLSKLEELVITKLFKPKVLYKAASLMIKTILQCKLMSYSHEELLRRTSAKFPIIVNCSFGHLQKLCENLNEGRMNIKNVEELKNTFEMRQFLWKNMEEENWIVLTSYSTKENAKMLQNIVQYVLNYDLQPNFRVFIFVDQLQTLVLQSNESKIIAQSKYLESIGIGLYEEELCLEKLLTQNPYSEEADTIVQSVMVNASLLTKQGYKKKLYNYICILHAAISLKYPTKSYGKVLNRIFQMLDYLVKHDLSIQFNVNYIGQYIAKIYQCSFSYPERLDIDEMIVRIIDETKIQEKTLFGLPTLNYVQIDKKLKKNTAIFGCEESLLLKRQEEELKAMMETLFEIKFEGRNVREEVPEIRSALTRVPNQFIIFSRQTKNQSFILPFLTQMNEHNKNIVKIREFMEWMNVYSKEDMVVKEEEGTVEDVFNWKNLITKIQQVIGLRVEKNKIRISLSNWIQNLKRKHEFLLYWNLDIPVLTLHPVLFFNFPMLVSTYIINFLSTNYQKIKAQSESLNQSILYTLQIQFSRATDQKELVINEGIMLPSLIYKQFKYNFQLKMLDASLESSGEENASLILLRMRKVQKNRKYDDYSSPPIQIGRRINGNIQSIYKIQTYIDGHYPQWFLRRPMLISQ